MTHPANRCHTRECFKPVRSGRSFCLDCEYRRMRRTLDLHTAVENLFRDLTAAEQDTAVNAVLLAMDRIKRDTINA